MFNQKEREMARIGIKGIENKIWEFLESKKSKHISNAGQVSLITEKVICLSEFNNHFQYELENLLKPYGYEFEGGNFIDQIVIFIKK